MLTVITNAGLAVSMPTVLQISQTTFRRVSEATVRSQFPAVGLALSPPPGFVLATAFHGFQQPSTGASMMLTSVPAAFSIFQENLSPSTLKAKGLRAVSKTTVRIENQPGILLKVRQTAYGQEVLKWILIFGSEARTYTVTATVPEAYSATLGEMLKRSVLSVSTVEVSPQQAQELPFTLTPAQGLLPVSEIRSMGKVMAFTQDGSLHTASPDLPFLIVAPSLGAVPVLDYKSYALKRLRQTSQTHITAVESVMSITIDGLNGYEVTAKGTDIGSGKALKIYQAMLFLRNGGYIIMTGLVGQALAPLYLPKFKATARTFRCRASLESVKEGSCGNVEIR